MKVEPSRKIRPPSGGRRRHANRGRLSALGKRPGFDGGGRAQNWHIVFAHGVGFGCGGFGATRVCNAIVGGLDMTLGAAVEPVLDAHIAASGGRFRAIRYSSLREIGMQDQNFGWTVEMQIKAVVHQLRIKEISVRYRPRIGRSKISGTVSGCMKAGWKILWTIFRYRLVTSRSRVEEE